MNIPQMNTAILDQAVQILPPNAVNYTRTHVSHFHKTILAILEDRDLRKLSVEDFDNVQLFTKLIVELIAAPPGIYLEEDTRFLYNYPNGIAPELKVQKAGTLKRSKQSLQALCVWIAEILALGNPSLEEILNHYYENFPYAQTFIFLNPIMLYN